MVVTVPQHPQSAGRCVLRRPPRHAYAAIQVVTRKVANGVARCCKRPLGHTLTSSFAPPPPSHASPTATCAEQVVLSSVSVENPVFLQEYALREPRPLCDGDVFSVGSQRFRFEAGTLRLSPECVWSHFPTVFPMSETT